MGTCVHFSRSLPSNSWWQTMAGWQALSSPPAAEGGGRRPAFTGLATQPYSATEVDGWQHKLSRVSQNRAAVQTLAPGLTPRAVLEKLAAMQMIDVELPTTDNRMVVLSRYTEPEKDLLLLLRQLQIQLPAQPPPKIKARNNREVA